MRNRLPYAGFGVLATLFGMAAGHLVAALADPDASPVLAVGSAVIDLTPQPLKEWAIQHFGSNDKTVLVGSVVVGALLLAAVGGLLARRRFALGAAVLVVLVALAAAAALARPDAAVLDLLPALVTAITGVGALWWLTRAAEAPGTAVVPAAGGSSRRGVLIASGLLAAGAAVLGGAGRYIIGRRTDPAGVTLPKAADPAPAFPQGIEGKVPGVSPFRTPRDTFYRVDTRLTLPIISLDDYRLTVDGDVDHELTFTYDDLLAMDLIERDITLTCVSNDVGGPYVGGARWLGVPLKTILDQAGVGSRANQIYCTDVDGMTISVPLELATDGRDAMIAVGMDGQALPQKHGFPVRMVVPGLYGFISACKWLTRMTLTTYAEDSAYWTDRDWATDAPIKPASRIDTPKSFDTIKAGDTFIGGVAWAQHDGIARVEVRVDGGDWKPAQLGPSAGDDYWRQWFLPWTATPGEHQLSVRATTRSGQVQSPVKAMPFPDGASGLQQIVVRVA